MRKCRDILGHEPYKTVNNGKGYNFTFLGYEAGLLFLSSYQEYGPEFINCICNLEKVLPQAHYKFEWNTVGGFSNTGLNFINFTPEYELKRIDFDSLEELNNSSTYLDVDVNQFFTP